MNGIIAVNCHSRRDIKNETRRQTNFDMRITRFSSCGMIFDKRTMEKEKGEWQIVTLSRDLFGRGWDRMPFSPKPNSRSHSAYYLMLHALY